MSTEGAIGLQIAAAILGVSGSFLVAQRAVPDRRWGYIMWIFSNSILIVLFSIAGWWPLLFMQIMYQGSSILGLINNWREA